MKKMKIGYNLEFATTDRILPISGGMTTPIRHKKELKKDMQEINSNKNANTALLLLILLAKPKTPTKETHPNIEGIIMLVAT